MRSILFALIALFALASTSEAHDWRVGNRVLGVHRGVSLSVPFVSLNVGGVHNAALLRDLARQQRDAEILAALAAQRRFNAYSSGVQYVPVPSYSGFGVQTFAAPGGCGAFLAY